MNIISNFHTHSTFCDGKHTPEEIVLEAIEKEFSSIGFSGHGYTPYDLRYCMKDAESYIAEIQRLQEKYADRIPIYLGCEEDAFAPVDRSRYEYIVGSSHYYHVDGKYLPIDSSFDYFKACLDAFKYDLPRMAEVYYSNFCAYISDRRPDIIGHFDLITKFDELSEPYFTGTPEYAKISEKYTLEALQSDCIFEVNTGAISRGFRTSPYPHEDLLYLMKKQRAKLILSSDSHQKETLDFYFEESKRYLYDLGFRQLYTLSRDGFAPYFIK